MNQSNRCPECGGTASHIITDIKGESYYHCTRGLTTFKEDWDEAEGRLLSRTSRIRLCDTIIHRGKVFGGTIAYAVEGGVKTLMVTNGKI